MAHIRTRIRSAVAAAAAAAAPAGWQVERSRERVVDLAEMPRLLVGVRREVAQPDGTCLPARRDFAVELTAHIAVSREEDIEDALDEASIWIERAIDADPTLGGLARETLYRGADLDLIVGGERPAGRITLAFDIRASAPTDSF